MTLIVVLVEKKLKQVEAIRSDDLALSNGLDYALETATRILNMVLTKKVDKTPYELCGRVVELEEIQDEDTPPSKNTSKIPMEVEGFKPPQEEFVHVRRSERTHRAPKRLCLNVEVEEHSLGYLNEPTNYKAALLDPESDKWLGAINAEMQSMKDNQVWRLVDLPSNGETSFILGIKIYRDRSKRLIGLSQSAYMDNILKRYKMDNSKHGNIPMQEIFDLNKTQDMNLVYDGNPEVEYRVDCYCNAGFETDRDDIKS
ncbi:hypothetical protein Tco_0371431 [Tanacetum coccineum]